MTEPICYSYRGLSAFLSWITIVSSSVFTLGCQPVTRLSPIHVGLKSSDPDEQLIYLLALASHLYSKMHKWLVSANFT